MRSILKLRYWRKPRIFITYRRRDTDGHAGRLYADLIESFPKKNVFFDIGALKGGDEFPVEIEKRLNACEALIVVIGRSWLTISEGGARRLDNPEDLVRREIAIALKRKIMVIPALVQGAPMPTEGELPEELRPLARRNSMEISDKRWDYDIGQLVDRLKRAAAPSEGAPAHTTLWRKAALALAGLAVAALCVWGGYRILFSSPSQGSNGAAVNSSNAGTGAAPPQPQTSQTTNTALPAQAAQSPNLGELKVYFGNLHAHSAYSDGSGTPDEAYQYANNQGALDFLAITDHNHQGAEAGLRSELDPELADRLRDGLMIATDPGLYTKTIQDAIKNTRDDDFVALYGQEFSTISSGNHLNVYSADSVIDVPNGSFDTLYDSWLPRHQEVPFIQFNHPSPPREERQRNQYGLDDYGGDYERLRAAVARYPTLIEVASGPAMIVDTGQAKLDGEESYRHYLTRGFRLAPTAGQDNHFKTWGTATDARTAVLARRLTGPDLVEALKSRRCYATTDKNLKVWLTVNRAVMGSEVGARLRQVVVQYIIDDDDEPHADYEVVIVSGSPEAPDSAAETPLFARRGKHQAQTLFDLKTDAAFVYLKIKQTSGDNPQDVVLTSPVWVKVGS